jgi:Lon protease-like protein
MFYPHELTLEDFAGRARLFPLPNLVLFPHIVQPLHIFEPRYRDLLADALAADRLIALATLAPGWEKDADGRPPILSTACLGRIAGHQTLADGRSNILLLGLRRVRVVSEMPAERSYREARVQVLDDLYSADGAAARPALLRRLLVALEKRLKAVPAAAAQLKELLSGTVSLGVLCDLLTYALDWPTDVKAEMLAECNVDRRARLVMDRLEAAGEAPAQPRRRRYPLDFSDN